MALKINLDADDDGLREYFIKEVLAARSQATTAKRIKDRHWHRGRASAFREALETTDAAIRSQAEGAAVEIRRAEDIINEVKGN